MTREERESFVRDTIAEFGFDKDGVRRIVDKWEQDVEEHYTEARDNGFDAGYDVGYESGRSLLRDGI